MIWIEGATGGMKFHYERALLSLEVDGIGAGGRIEIPEGGRSREARFVGEPLADQPDSEWNRGRDGPIAPV